MLSLTSEEQERCQVVVTGSFPTVDIVIRSRVFHHNNPSEPVMLVGPETALNQLYGHLHKLLSKGEGYYWSGVRRRSSAEILMWLDGLTLETTRVELVEYLFRRDLIVHAGLCLSEVAEIVVVSPWGNIVQKQLIGLPGDENGSTVLSALA